MTIGDTVSRLEDGRVVTFVINNQKELEYHQSLADSLEYRVLPKIHRTLETCTSCEG